MKIIVNFQDNIPLRGIHTFSPGSSPLKITCLWTQRGNWVPIQLQVLQPAASCIIQAKIYFLQIWLTFLFAFISLKHNKLQMIQWGYHNCYGNLELRADFWLKTKNGFIDNTATDEEKKTSNDWV